MKKFLAPLRLALLSAALAVCFSVHAQFPGPPQRALREMAKLKFLVGSWRGEGWVEFAPGQRQVFRGSEDVQMKLDGLAALIEGIHHATFPGQTRETKVHHALATVMFDESSGKLRLMAIKSDGKSLQAEAEVKDGAFVWGFKDPRLGQTRYTIRLNSAGQWSEIGERSSDGATWQKFLEMTLSKTSGARP